MAISPSKIYFFNLFVKICPPSRCQALKSKLLRWAGAKVGDNVEIFSPKILGNLNLIIGDSCFLGHDALIMGPIGSTVEMEDGSHLASRAMLITGYHEYDLYGPCVTGPGKFDNIKLEKGSVVDTLSMVCPGVIVGEKAHVTACSIARHNVPPYAQVLGSPAKVVGFPFRPDEIIEYEKSSRPNEKRHTEDFIRKNYDKFFLKKSREILAYMRQSL